MKKILINLLWWFGLVFLSFLISNTWGWNQGKVYLYTYTILGIIWWIYYSVLNLEKTKENAICASGVPIFVILFVVAVCFGVSKLFSIDFYVAFEIITLGTCLGFEQ